MKKKNGFTLIELLAIIVILAIIAVITVPIILNIIENSKMGAAQDSAYGYKDAIKKWYIGKLSTDPNYNIPDGVYTVGELGEQVEGQKPDSSLSWIKVKKNEITDGCLQFDEYKVEIKEGKVGTAAIGECEEYVGPVVYTNKGDETPKAISDPIKDIAKEDYVTIGEESFFVIAVDSDKVTLLGANCLKKITDANDNETWRQRKDGEACTQSTFSSENYWHDSSANKVKDTYAHDVTGTKTAVYLGTGNHNVISGYVAPYVYYTAEGTTDSNNITDIINAYTETIPIATHGRLLAHEEAYYLTDKTNNVSISYWLGSAYNSNYMWSAYTYRFYNTLPGETQSIRPVIEVPTSAF